MQSLKSNMCQIDRSHNVVRFDSSIAFIDSCRSLVNRIDKHQQHHDDDNDDVSVLKNGRVGIGGSHVQGVDGECMSDRGFKSRGKSIAYSDTMNTSISDNDDNMTTTDNDDKTTKARRATHAGLIWTARL